MAAKPSGRKGRVDVLVQDAAEGAVAVLEIKNSDWDKMTPEAVRRNIRRQIRQIWNYIDSHLAKGTDGFPGIVFPNRPADQERLELIEQIFAEEGIPVVWEDESIQECKKRKG